MCGICGIIDFNNKVDQNKVASMMRAMKHRGPDDEGIFSHENICIGHVRLSIIDLSKSGHQPMISDDNRYIISYNGEIYNYLELKKELKNKYRFYSESDTEVLLNAYIEWGQDCLDKLNGMFAFVIYDKLENKIFGARDRYGIKPFYYYLDDKFIFASDIPSIIASEEYKPQVNNKSVYDYLVFGRTDQDENTFFKGIKKLQHGHCFEVKDNELNIKKWYSLKINIPNETLNPFEKFDELFQSSLKLRLRSDVPIGVCLSGGVDSSAIVSVLNKKMKLNNINSFSAIYKNYIKDESQYIEALRPFSNEMFFTEPNSVSFYNDLDDLMNAHSEPFSTTAIYAQYKVMSLAQNNVKVLLDGQGADEYLAGYHYFHGFYFIELLKTLSFLNFFNEVFYNIKNTKSLYGLMSTIFFMLPSTVKEKILNSSKSYLYNDFKNNYKGSIISNHLYSSKDLNSALINHFEYKLEHLLKWEDRNSMWFSLESRVPFLDHRLVEYLFTLPSYYKIRNGETKHILKKVYKNIIPPKILNRNDKIGFSTPESKWLRNKDFSKLIKNVILDIRDKNLGIINPDLFEKKYNDFLLMKNNDSSDIWRVANFQLWINKYF